MSVHMYIFVYVCMYVYIPTHTYACMMYLCVCVHTCVFVCSLIYLLWLHIMSMPLCDRLASATYAPLLYNLHTKPPWSIVYQPLVLPIKCATFVSTSSTTFPKGGHQQIYQAFSTYSVGSLPFVGTPNNVNLFSTATLSTFPKEGCQKIYQTSSTCSFASLLFYATHFFE